MKQKEIIEKLKELSIARDMCMFQDYVSDDDEEIQDYIEANDVDYDFYSLKPIMSKFNGCGFDDIESKAFTLIKQL